MKDFLKFTLATVTGIVLVCVVGFILSLVTLFSIVAMSEQEVPVPEKSVFALRLDKALQERAVQDPMAMLMGSSYETIGLDDVLTSIKKAKENEDIKGIYLEAGNFPGANPAELEAIRKALLDFKQSGKFIVAYGDAYTQGEYYLCSVADKVVLNPSGSIVWKGLAAQPVFYKELLENIGVKMQIFKVGTYKSAVEPFIADKMSDANREQVTAYLGSIWEEMVNGVSASRGLSAAHLNECADRLAGMAPAKAFVEAGLADTLLYMDGMKTMLKELVGAEEDEDLSTLELADMVNVKRNVPLDKSGNIVAVYYATGDIIESEQGQMPGSEECIVGTKVIRDLSRLREDENVKAVVLRVNSPGGSAFASEQIWNEVMKLKAEKPVIVSMGGLAASGGYYISCAADSIFAEATTLTGSIGIFGMVPDMEGLLTGKLGLHYDLVKTNEHSDFGVTNRPLTESEKQLVQNSINQGYDLFIKRCADGRGVGEAHIRRVAEGRVWTGSMAKELGLVDALGGIDDAIEAAVTKAGIENYTLLSHPAKVSVFDSFMQQGVDHYISSKLKARTGEFYPLLQTLERVQRADRVQARIEMEPNIKL